MGVGCAMSQVPTASKGREVSPQVGERDGETWAVGTGGGVLHAGFLGDVTAELESQSSQKD